MKSFPWLFHLAGEGDLGEAVGQHGPLGDADAVGGILFQGQQLKHLMEENRRMKQQRRINVRDENELQGAAERSSASLRLCEACCRKTASM